MLLLILSTIPIGIAFYFYKVKPYKNNVLTEVLTHPIFIAMYFAIIITSVLALPLSGYTDWELVEEANLTPISSSTYVEEIADKNIFIYEDEEHRLHTLIDQKVEFEESNTPVLQKYEKKPKRTTWTFAFFSKNQVKYTFCIPG